MSNPSIAIYHLLANDGSVSGIVSDRIYQMRTLQGSSFPAIMIQKISDVPFSNKDGNEFFRARIQVSSYAENQASANELARYCMDAIDRQSGTINTIDVAQIDIINEVETMENFADFEGIFRVIQDYSIIYNRTYGS